MDDDKRQAILDQLKGLHATTTVISWQLFFLIAVVVVAMWRFW